MEAKWEEPKFDRAEQKKCLLMYINKKCEYQVTVSSQVKQKECKMLWGKM